MIAWQSITKLLGIHIYVQKFSFRHNQPVQLTSITDVARSQPVTWTLSDVTADVLSLSCTCTGVAQGLGGKKRGAVGGGGCRGGWGTKWGPIGQKRGKGGRVALTYLCRVLHATPISGVVGTNPLCACHTGWIEATRYVDLVRVLHGDVCGNL